MSGGLLARFLHGVSTQVMLNAWTFCSPSEMQPWKTAGATAPLGSREERFAVTAAGLACLLEQRVFEGPVGVVTMTAQAGTGRTQEQLQNRR